MGVGGVSTTHVDTTENIHTKFQEQTVRIPQNVSVFWPLADNLENLQPLVQERLADLLRVLKAVIRKHQTLNSVDILGAAGAVIAKVKGQ